MADFNSFFPTLLKHEGGFVDDPDDPGGATNKGITFGTFQKCAKNLLGIQPTLDNLHALTDRQAGTIYKALYWDKVHGDEIALQPLANIVFDFQVNAGANASRLLQRVLNAQGVAPQLVVDGAIGAGTLGALTQANAVAVYAAYKQGRRDYYTNLVKKRRTLGKFLNGWLARVDSFPDLAPATTKGA
ncbi:MAG TPA: glycosyl hydrolase 108 family protein [Pinirhizobacter sp.]|uniref:glycoside hydrolase family 108 protein n=1 Tax=Pinirhizobacter sp. TaxID=2950432 RepID=UPI002B786ED8|nr:glycosyl hydrolase 108 family protein [Pinirhizobacter sp.]HMH66891.1 glycosyl hydrolase 108 family protein [Pinirhizobacter sp.]